MGIQTEERANRLGAMAEGTVSAPNEQEILGQSMLGKLSTDSFLS